MRLVVLIPAYNEEKTISKVIKSIPKKIPFIQEINILVIDDGSSDKTVDLALNAGADKVVSHRTNLGVGAAFMTGIRNAIKMKADIVVTLDADSQFDAKQISELVVPVINKELDVVIGSRFLENKKLKMPKIKKIGNKIFTKILSVILEQKFTDTQTGFRAYSKDTLYNITIVNNFTYTQEVLIDLKFKGMRIGEIPVSVTYDDARKSRVVKNIFSYSYKALSIIIKSLTYHRPIFTFGLLGSVLIGGGIVAKLITISKSLIISSELSTGLIILGIVSFMMGLFASIVFKRQSFAENELRRLASKTLEEK